MSFVTTFQKLHTSLYFQYFRHRCWCQHHSVVAAVDVGVVAFPAVVDFNVVVVAVVTIIFSCVVAIVAVIIFTVVVVAVVVVVVDTVKTVLRHHRDVQFLSH